MARQNDFPQMKRMTMLKVIRAVIGDGIGGEAYDAEK